MSTGLNGFTTPLLDSVESANNLRESFFVWQLLAKPGQFHEEVRLNPLVFKIILCITAVMLLQRFNIALPGKC